MDYQKHITRTQLKGYGISYYQAKVITKNLVPIEKEKNTNIYLLSDAIASIKEYLAKPKITAKTRQALNSVLPKLFEQLDNITPIIFGNGTDKELNKLSKNLFTKVTKAKQNSIKAKAKISQLKGKYKK